MQNLLSILFYSKVWFLMGQCTEEGHYLGQHKNEWLNYSQKRDDNMCYMYCRSRPIETVWGTNRIARE